MSAARPPAVLPRAVRAGGDAVLTALVVLAAAAVAAAWVLGVRAVPVLTGSMAPAAPAGSLVLTTPRAADGVRVGDVVVFRPPPDHPTPGDRPVLHRVHELRDVGGTRAMTTKGDANLRPDPWLVDLRAGTQLGAVRLVVPGAGRLLAGGSGGTATLLAGGALVVVAVRTWPRASRCGCP